MDLVQTGNDPPVDALAHVQPSAAPFNLDLVAPVTLAVLAALSRRSRDAVLLLVAAVALASTALPPLHGLAGNSVTGHMVQHLVLVMVVAPCIGIVAATAPTRARRTPLVSRIGRALIAAPASPLIAGLAHVGLLALWHVPGPYDAAVASWPMHAAEHLSLVATGAWWWASVTHHALRHSPAGPIVSLFAVATGGAVMGVFIMFAPTALYGQGGLGDQQTAGALMAGATGGLYGGAALWLVARTVGSLGEPRPVRVPSRGSASLAVVGVCGLASLALTGLIRQATDPDADRDLPAIDAEGVDLGRELYRRDCASCHGPNGEGSFRGTSLIEAGTASVAYMLDTGRMPIGRPGEVIQRGEPAYSDVEIEAIVGYLAAIIDGPAAVEPVLAGADLSRGGEHYRLHCAACHGAEGIGGALAFEGFAPSVLPSSPADVANAMLSGPGAMPAFAATFDESDMADVAAYVAWLQDPPRTGLPLPGGRVGEGLVAWVAGLGALIVAARWVGTRQ
jgi:ubiquinol-cytochrome c reductase cytochrome c subunit